MKKKISFLIALSLAITSAAGCGQSTVTAATTTAAETTASVAVAEAAEITVAEKAEETEESSETEAAEETPAEAEEQTGEEEVDIQLDKLEEGMANGFSTKVGAGISSISKEAADAIFQLGDPYYGKGIITDAALTSKNVKFYINAIGEDGDFAYDESDVYFMDEAQSVPYMKLDDLVEVYNAIIGAMTEAQLPGANMYVRGQAYDEMYTLTRDNGSMVIFDLAANTIWMMKPDLFTSYDTSAAPIDIIATGGTDPDEDFILHIKLNYIEGNDLYIDLNEYGIHMIVEDGVVYFPVSTFSDLFFAKFYNGIAYNTENLFSVQNGAFGASADNLTEYGELYYNVEQPAERSSELRLFTYSELCLACDYFYGLKSDHDIDSFNEYFYRTGLYEGLLSKDVNEYATALEKLTYLYFSDKHSAVNLGSVYTGPISLMSLKETDVPLLQSMITILTNGTVDAAAPRTELYGSAAPNGYTEVGDTAFITFDSFAMIKSDYTAEELENDPSDTIGLILYAHSQITRENSPIKNVVLNLANNGGGAADAAAAVISWFLGTSGNISTRNTTTSAESMMMYLLDMNLDGAIDPSEDTLAGLGLNLYCVTSNNSFSCGNLVPAALKASGRVKMLGQTSGGGSCVVQPLITPDGVTYQISGNRRLSVVKNGSYYNVDKGVDPDVFIAEDFNLFNEEYITELIHSIN